MQLIYRLPGELLPHKAHAQAVETGDSKLAIIPHGLSPIVVHPSGFCLRPKDTWVAFR